MNDVTKKYSFQTRAVRGESPEISATERIYLATAYVQQSADGGGKYDYSRSGNPTREDFEKRIASLENGCKGFAFASGMAATTAIMMLLKPGDHVVLGTDLYGGTFRLVNKVMSGFGIERTHVRTHNIHEVSSAITSKTKLVWLETPGNPLLSITDIRKVVESVKAANVIVAVDNTFASPVLTRPLDLGADFVMHSATKFIGGHSDVLAGVVVAREQTLAEKLYYVQNACGAVLSPFDCFLCATGLQTMPLRVEAQSDSALRIAQNLSSHTAVERVYYPGLTSHPGHDIAKAQMSNRFGSVMSIELKADLAKTKRFVESVQIFHLALSLGAVESLIELPATLSHASYDPKARRENGIADSLVRLSIGLEDPEDLLDDLHRALDLAGL